LARDRNKISIPIRLSGQWISTRDGLVVSVINLVSIRTNHATALDQCVDSTASVPAEEFNINLPLGAAL
jgi:hypothetical protein